MKKSSKSEIKKEKTKFSNEKLKKSNKKKYLIIGVLVIAVVLISMFLFINSNEEKIAYLSGVSGQVEIYQNGTWMQAIQGQDIFLNNQIKTSSGASANLILLGKAIITIDENTQIEVMSLLENNIKIKQESGSTWNKFLGLVGKDSYQVQTPDAVASVRGTEFGIDISVNSSIVLVGEGIVNFGTNNKTFDLTEFEKAGVINKSLIRLKLTQKDKLRFLVRKKQIINSLKKMREEQIKNLGPLITFAKKTYGLSDEDVQEKLDAIDRGEINDAKLIEKAPFKKDELRKIKKINDEIKKIQFEIKELANLRTNATQN